MAALRSEPDWTGAAQAFVAGLEAQRELDGRVEFIEACRAAFGEKIYPGFLKLLAAVSALGDEPVRALAAEALAHALATSRLPAVRVAAFGGASPGFAGFGGLSTHLRSAGPIEYLCVWLTRDLGEGRLEPDGFRTALAHLIALFDVSPRAAALYRARLAADADNPMEGLYNHETRALVRALAAAWTAGAPADEVAERTLAAARAPEPRRDPFAGLLR